MFKVVSEPTFTATVTVLTPVDGGHHAETFKGTFWLLDDDEVDKFDLNSRQGSVDFFKRAIVSLSDLVGDNDEPLTYSEALRDRLLKRPNVRIGLAVAYFDGVAKDQKAKN